MRRINDPERLSRLIEENGLRNIFDESAIRTMELIEYGKGDKVVAEGAPLTHLLLVTSGKLKLFRLLPNGRAILIRFYRPLSLIGDLELLSGSPANCTAEAVGHATVIAVPMECLRKHAIDDPRFLRFVIRQLAGKLNTISNASSINQLYPLENRLASYLVSVTEEARAGGDRDEIRTPKLTEVAELLGAGYRHLNRVLTRFAADGLVERKRGILTVKDLQGLKKLAEGNMYS